MPIGKNANVAWKQHTASGGTLSFTEFLDREKKKIYSADGKDDNILIVNHQLNKEVQDTIDKILSSGGLKKQENKTSILGINKTAFFIGSGLLVTAVVILYIKMKKS